MKKLHILIPSLVATVSMPLVSMVGCEDPDEPTLKTMTIKQQDGQKLPKLLDVDQKIKLAAYHDNSLVSGVVFTTNSSNITLNGNEVTSKAEGKATITCTAEGYEQASWNFSVQQLPDPVDDPITLDQWNNEKGYLYKDNFCCDDEQEMTVIINFKDYWDPDSADKKQIVGEIHIINDSKTSYDFVTDTTNITVDGKVLEWGQYNKDWMWGKDFERNVFFIKILNTEVIEGLINAECVEISTQLYVSGGEPGPFGFYAI